MMLVKMHHKDVPGPPGFDETRLVELARQAPDHFLRLYDRHVDDVYRYLLLSGEVPLAETLTSRTFGIAQRRLRQFQGAHSFRVWLFQIARQQLLHAAGADQRGARQLQRRGRQDGDMPEWIFPLAALPIGQAEALMLRMFIGMSTRESAAILNQSDNEVRMLVYLGLKKLRTLDHEDMQEAI